MKLIHLSDLHLGKRIYGFSMIEDQNYILKRILNIIDAEHPDAVLIAGDIYDKPIPPAEAVELFDDFIVRLAKRHLQVFIISGNHDSPERLSFANRLIDSSGIHFSPVYDGSVKHISLEDEYGIVNIYMLPFIKPVHVRRFFPEEDIGTWTDAVRTALHHLQPEAAGAQAEASQSATERRDEQPRTAWQEEAGQQSAGEQQPAGEPAAGSARNVLVAHQFVTGAERSESEEISVGGADNVDASAFDGWDYVALGHIHGPQRIGTDAIRYSGTPLKYSFSEAKHQKSVSVVELKEKGNLSVRCVPLIPLRDMAEIRGSYMEITARSFYADTSLQEDYVHVILTDEEDIPDAMTKLRVIYRNLMKLDYDNTRTRSITQIEGAAAVEQKSPLELFAEFYEQQNGAPMSDEQSAFVQKLLEEME